MTSNYLPSLSPYLGGDINIDARVANRSPPENLFTAGIKSGFFEGLSGASSAVSALGKLSGNEYLQRQGQYASEEEAAQARQYGRPDLEGGIFDQSPQTFLPYVGYQLSKTIPTLATAIGASALIPEAAIPAGLARAAEVVPSVLRAGQTGAEFARAGVGAFAAQYPAISGNMYAQAQERELKGGEKASNADAAKAFLLGVPVTALGAIEPALATGQLLKGSLGKVGERVVRGGVSQAAAEGIQEGVEEAANMSFRPDISANDKFKAILDATVTGSVLGGITGGVLGIHKAREKAQDITNEGLAQKVDEVLALPAPTPKQLQTEQTGLGPIEQGYTSQLRLPAPTPKQLQTEQTGLGPIEQGYTSQLRLPAPIPKQLQTEQTGLGPIEQGFSPLDLTGEQYDQNIDLTQRSQEVISPERQEQRIDQPDLFRSPEVFGNLEERINDKRQKLTPQEKVLAQEVGLLNKSGRKRDIDREIIANTARQETILEKLKSDRARKNKGLQTKLQAQLEDAQKVRKELEGFKSLREQADALQEPSTKRVLPREDAQVSNEVGQRDTKRDAVTETRKETAIEPEVRKEEIVSPIQSKVEDPLGILNNPEKVMASQTLGQNIPKAKTPGQIRREQIAAAAKATPSTTELPPVKRAAQPKASKEARIADVAANQEAKKLEQAQNPIQKLTKEKQAAPVRDIMASASMATVGRRKFTPGEANIPQAEVTNKPYKRLTKEEQTAFLKSSPTSTALNKPLNIEVPEGKNTVQTQQEPKSNLVYKAFENLTGGKYNQRVRITDIKQELKNLGVADLNTQNNLIREVGFSNNADLLQLDNRIDITDNDRRDALHLGKESRHLLWIISKPNDIKFKRSIEDRLATIIDPTNEFDRGFKKAIDVLGPNATDRIDVVNTASELPDNILAEMQRQGIEAPAAAYDGQTGRTILVKDKFKNAADVQQAIFHEIFGHEGLQRIGGKDFDNFTKDMFDRAGGIDGITKLAKKFGVDRTFDEYIAAYNDGLVDDINIVDEFLAHAAERPKGKVGATLNAWVGDFKRGLVGFLKTIGFNQFANKLNKFDNWEVARLLRDMRQAVQAGGEFARPVQEAIAFKRSVDGTNDTFANATDFGNQLLQGINRAGFGPRNITNKVREMTLGWMPLTGIAEQYRHIFPSVDKLVEAWHNRDVIAQRFNENAGNVYKDITSLSKNDQKAFNDVARASEFGFDLRKPWELHTELHNLKNTTELKSEFDRLQKVFKDLNKGIGKDVYERAVALGESENYAKAASDLYAMRSLLYGNETINGFEENPAKAFQQNKDVHGDPGKSRDFWKQIVEQQKRGIEEFVKYNKDNNIGIDTLPLESALDIAERRLDAANKAPYFSLGRHGNYFVTFTVPTDDQGLPKKESIVKLQEALDKRGFNDVAINQASDQDRVYIRVENEDIMETLYSLAKDLQKDGTLSDKEILRGAKTQSNILGKLAPKYLDKMIQALDKHVDKDIDPALQRVRDGMKSELRGMLLDILPDQAITKVYQQRKGRQGYSTDAARNMAFRSQVTANAISNLAILSDVSKSFGEMRKQALSATGDPNVNPVELNQVLNELSLREANRPFSPPNTLVDALRGLNFTYFLGMSPAYMVQQVSQVPLIGLPELAKQQGVGFAKAGKTIASVTTPAFKIMKAVSEGRYGLDAHITKEALQKAGISQGTSDYILNLINRGDIDLGSFGRELSRISHGQVGGTAERALRWANSTIVYSETFSRLQMALAAERLGLSQDQASNLIKNSMFTYGSWNSPRAIGRMGILGPVSPLAFAFTNYQIQMLEKMYRELNTAFFNKAKTPAERTAARKFLAGHITAAMVTAGTLGFPAAGWLAGAASRLTDLFDGDEGEGYDVEAAYRNWLATTLGKDFGEVVARGLPRALGIDLQNYGDQNLLPFTKLMQDRSKFEDSFPAYLKDLAGAPFSMIGNLITGGRKIAEGDILGGATQLAPRAFHAGIDAFRMIPEDGGYFDTKGNKLPLDAKANDILARALGFQTGERAEYNEAAQAVRDEKYATKYRAEVIKQNLARAIESKDQESAKKYINEARNFDQRHPTNMILPNFASYLQRRQKSEIIADRINAPLGVRPADLESQRLTNFANF